MKKKEDISIERQNFPLNNEEEKESAANESVENMLDYEPVNAEIKDPDSPPSSDSDTTDINEEIVESNDRESVLEIPSPEDGLEDADSVYEDKDDLSDEEETSEEATENKILEVADEKNDTENDTTTAQNDKKPRKIDSIFDFIELFVFTLAAVFIITSFFFRYSTVKGDSMQNTLQNDEKLILSSLFYTPKPGDVVVVQDKSTELKDPIVKRVIAVEGQTVKFTSDTVYVDGVALIEDYVYTGDYYNPRNGSHDYEYDTEPCDALRDHLIGYQEGVYYEILVPDGEIFVMGDHRNNSKDSRDIGTLHEDAVLGKAVLRFYPFDKFGKIED